MEETRVQMWRVAANIIEYSVVDRGQGVILQLGVWRGSKNSSP